MNRKLIALNSDLILKEDLLKLVNGQYGISADALISLFDICTNQLKHEFSELISIKLGGSLTYLTGADIDVIPIDKISDIDINVNMLNSISYERVDELVEKFYALINRHVKRFGMNVTDVLRVMLTKTRGYIYFPDGQKRDADTFLRFFPTSDISVQDQEKKTKRFLVERFLDKHSIFWYRDYNEQNVLIPRIMTMEENPAKYVKKYITYEYYFGGEEGRESFNYFKDKFLNAPVDQMLELAKEVASLERIPQLEAVIESTAATYLD